jgi:hypothetical protein
MSKLTWDTRDYELGLDRGIYFPKIGLAEAWNGLLSVDEPAEDISSLVTYRDGIKVIDHKAPGSFAAAISTYSLPFSFLSNLKTPFGFSYRVKTEKGYRIHLVYNALAHIADAKYIQREPTPFSFSISTVPIVIPYGKPSAHIMIDTGIAWPEAVSDFEAILYGTLDSDPRLPLPEEVYSIFDVNALFRITDNGDGTYTMDGPDSAFDWIDPTMVGVEWPRVVYVDYETYIISSW